MSDRFDVILILFIFVIQQPLFIHLCYCWGKKNGRFLLLKKHKKIPKKKHQKKKTPKKEYKSQSNRHVFKKKCKEYSHH